VVESAHETNKAVMSALSGNRRQYEIHSPKPKHMQPWRKRGLTALCQNSSVTTRSFIPGVNLACGGKKGVRSCVVSFKLRVSSGHPLARPCLKAERREIETPECSTIQFPTLCSTHALLQHQYPSQGRWPPLQSKSLFRLQSQPHRWNSISHFVISAESTNFIPPRLIKTTRSLLYAFLSHMNS